MTHRQVLIDRLVYDPKVLQEVTRVAQAEGIPRQVALKRVEGYAREIVPAFNAYLYFRVGSGIGKALLNMLYRVRLGHADDTALKNLNPDVSVVFVMNDRSNVDYILVAHLARERVALSYAVGEWAKVWPIQQLVRSLGAYFVRRGSGNDLYRRVLERYVQIAVEGGAVQAIFPEGGLSRDGLLRQPKIGLLDYMLRAFDLRGGRDIVFVPVALNYDRVLEDRTLLRDTDPASEPNSGLAALRHARSRGAHREGHGIGGRLADGGRPHRPDPPGIAGRPVVCGRARARMDGGGNPQPGAEAAPASSGHCARIQGSSSARVGRSWSISACSNAFMSPRTCAALVLSPVNSKTLASCSPYRSLAWPCSSSTARSR